MFPGLFWVTEITRYFHKHFTEFSFYFQVWPWLKEWKPVQTCKCFPVNVKVMDTVCVFVSVCEYVCWSGRLVIVFFCAVFVALQALCLTLIMGVLSWFIQAFCGVRTKGHSISQNAPVGLMFRDAGHSYSDQCPQENVCLFQSSLSICKTFLPTHAHMQPVMN